MRTTYCRGLVFQDLFGSGIPHDVKDLQIFCDGSAVPQLPSEMPESMNLIADLLLRLCGIPRGILSPPRPSSMKAWRQFHTVGPACGIELLDPELSRRLSRDTEHRSRSRGERRYAELEDSRLSVLCVSATHPSGARRER